MFRFASNSLNRTKLELKYVYDRRTKQFLKLLIVPNWN